RATPWRRSHLYLGYRNGFSGRQLHPAPTRGLSLTALTHRLDRGCAAGALLPVVVSPLYWIGKLWGVRFDLGKQLIELSLDIGAARVVSSMTLEHCFQLMKSLVYRSRRREPVDSENLVVVGGLKRFKLTRYPRDDFVVRALRRRGLRLMCLFDLSEHSQSAQHADRAPDFFIGQARQ